MALFNPNHRWLHVGGWLQFFLLIGSISYLSLTPSPGAVFVSFWDKALHFAGWGALLLSLHFAWRQRHGFHYPALGLWAYSILIEIVQQFTGRQFSWGDIVANGLGIAVAFFVAPGLAGLYGWLGLWEKR